MRQIGDAAMAVLKVEGVEELLGFLVVDLGQRLTQGEGRTRLLGHAVGLHLGVGAVHGVDFGAGGVAGLMIIRGRFFSGRHCGESYAVELLMDNHRACGNQGKLLASGIPVASD